MGVGIVDGGILTGGNALNLGLARDVVDGAIDGVLFAREFAIGEVGGVSDFEFHVDAVEVAPDIGREVVETNQVDFFAILSLGGVALRNIEDIVLDVLFDYKPRSAAEEEAFALSNGVEPIAFVGAQYFACFELDNFAFLFAQIAAQEVVVVDFAQEADALTVFAFGRGELGLVGDLTDFAFH